ncbi:MAG: LegC family aminotransferase [Spirochaetes bacterium]|nr:LegC family aminotransferase [Spirochaetota bacterium]
MESFIPLSVPSFQGNEKKYVEEAVDTEWVSTGGAFVTRFEKTTAEYNGANFAVACSSGTAALHVALLEAGVEAGDEVIVPTVTFISPVNTIRYVGAVPVFMDCDEYLNMDMEKVEQFLTGECDFKGGTLIDRRSKKKVSAVVPVHVFGHPADMDRLMELSERYGLVVIEDATESLGSVYVKGRYEGRKTGTIGRFGCYSFNGNKIITTGGGGMIVTKDEKAASHMKYLTTQAKDDEVYFVHDEVGFNYRMTNLQAALGLAQLELLDRYIEIKRSNFRLYREALDGCRGLSLIDEPEYARSNFWFYSLLVDRERYGVSRDDLLKKLATHGVQARPLWKLNHLQKPYTGCLSFRIERAPALYERVLSIPCSVGLGEEELRRVVSLLRK